MRRTLLMLLIAVAAGCESAPVRTPEEARALARTRAYLDAGGDPDAGNFYAHPRLLLAAREGHVASARLLLDRGASPECPWTSPLAMATLGGHAEIAAMLLDAGADAAGRCHPMGTMLHTAVLANEPEIAALLLERGADPGADDEFGDTPLHKAATYARPALVAMLLKAGADPNARNRMNRTPLHVLGKMAAHEGPDRRGEVARKLLGAMAEARATDGRRNTPLHYAAGGGCPEVVDLLLKHGADPRAKSAADLGPADHARRNGHDVLARRLDDAAKERP